MTELEGPHELRVLAETAHKFVKGYMTRRHIHDPPTVFLTNQGIMIPDPKDFGNAPRVFQRFLELAGECYAKSFIARLRNEDGDTVHEDALLTIASDSGDLTYHISLPFLIEREEEQIVGILWEEEQCGWQSRIEYRAHLQTLSPRQQRLLDYIRVESGMEDQPLDWLRMLGMKMVHYPIRDADSVNERKLNRRG